MWPTFSGHYFCTASNISIPSLTDLTTLHISPIIINTGTPVTICAYINIHIFEEKYRDVSSNVKLSRLPPWNWLFPLLDVMF